MARIPILLLLALPWLGQEPVAPRKGAMQVLVPAYFYPVAGSPWDRMCASASAHPGRITAIGNPFNGPGNAVDPAYVSVFRDFQNAGGTLIGYVRTNWGAQPLPAVKADIDAWFAWYAPDGIFLDEMNNVAGEKEGYHKAIYAYVQSKKPGAVVVGNPGTSSAPSYLEHGGNRVVDALVVFETHPGFFGWSNEAWTRAWPRRRFGALPYAIDASLWEDALDHAVANRVAWTYVTDDDLPNPWDSLPSYFEALVDRVDALY